MKKTIIAITAMAAISATSVGICQAQDQKPNPIRALRPAAMPMQPLSPAQRQQMRQLHRFVKMAKIRCNPWNLGLYKNKNLSADDAKVLVKAALLMRNRHDLKIGKIASQTGRYGQTVYLTDIVDRDNKVVSRVMVNSNTGRIRPAMPMRSLTPATTKSS